jgi:phosphoribosyl-ATP pyrophosphohydrolase
MSMTILQTLTETIEARKQASPDSSYVAKLFSKGEDAILKKIGEEATETILASKEGDKSHIVYETADLWFHTMVMLSHHGLSASDVLAELARREGLSGIAEKNSRINGQVTSVAAEIDTDHARFPLHNPLPQAGEEANDSQRELHVKDNDE